MIVAAMRAHPGVAAVANEGCWALRNITVSFPAGKQAAVDAGAPTAIVAAMRAHPGVAAVAEYGRRALAALGLSQT